MKTLKQIQEEKKEKVFLKVIDYRGKYYKVSNTLFDILTDSLSEHLSYALQETYEAGREDERKKYNKRLDAYANFEADVMDGIKPEEAQERLLKAIKKN